jgi:beta-galactosidase
MEDGRIVLDGVPRVLLCASLFPFRLPREQWADRIADVRRLGYDFIDLIVPWNFHETSPGTFDFTGRRDVEHFLRLVNDAGLLVLARPGPYICAEYDGGGYPAWLGTVDGLALRQNEPLHLQQVSRWFDHVLPLLARHQLPAGGPVALVQLENELDFSACDDPFGYIAALKKTADAHGILIPTITCAGEGDIARSNGNVHGVVPAVNLYPDDDATAVEDTTGHYARLLGDAGHPLIITESNRLHRSIKRMIISGARFVGPYLQASSWNYDLCTATNSWGAPYAFMASDYDFGGAIAPDGTERPDADEARILSQVLAALGPRLAAGTPTNSTGLDEALPARIAARALDLDGGGRLVGVTNLDGEPRTVAVAHRRGATDVRIAPGRCVLLPVDLPLADLGFPGTLLIADAEPIGLTSGARGAEITFHTDEALHLELETGTDVTVTEADGLTADTGDGVVTVRGRTGRITFTDLAGNGLTVRVVTTAEAAAPRAGAPRPPRSPATVDVRAVRTGRVHAEPVPSGAVAIGDVPEHLERHGIYRGSGIYTGSTRACRAIGLLLGEAADMLTAYVPGATPQMVVNGGQDLFIGFDRAVDVPDQATITVRADIWGHSNFHDERLPAMRLGSLRGISAAGLITAVEDLTHGWYISSPRGAAIVGTPKPYGTWAGWSSSGRPQHLTYQRMIARAEHGVLALRIADTQGVHDVELDGRVVGTITPLAPILDLTRYLATGDQTSMVVHAVRTFDQSFGHAQLLHGVGTHSWRVGAVGVDELTAAAQGSAETATDLSLPAVVSPGQHRWVHVPLDIPDLDPLSGSDLVARFAGKGVRLTVLHNGHVLARIFTEEPAGVQIRGGRGDVALVTPEWIAEDPFLHVLIEATETTDGRLDAVQFSHQIDIEPADM